MDRYRVIVTTVGAVVGVLMVLVFSFVAAESLLMKFLSGGEPAAAQPAGGDGSAASLHESSSDNDPVWQGESPEALMHDIDMQIRQTGGPQPAAAAGPGQQGLLTTVIESDLIVQTTNGVEQLIETLLPVEVELDAGGLLKQVQDGITGNSTTVKSLLSPIF